MFFLKKRNLKILTEIKKCFSLKFENEAQFLSFLNHLFLENEEIYRIAKVILKLA